MSIPRMVEVAKPIENFEPAPDIRAPELEQLLRWLQADQGSVAVVHGRRGVGKARLTEELVRAANALPQGVVLEGRTPTAGGRSFHPFAEIAHQAMAWTEQAGLSGTLIDPLYADLAAVLEHSAAEDDGVHSLDQKLRFFDALRRLLAGLAEHTRPLVVIHDLERADSDTLELASYLADELFGDPALDGDRSHAGLLVLLVRSDESTSPIAQHFLTDLLERRSARSIQLDGLDLDGLRRYVQSTHVLEKLLTASQGLPQEIDALIDALPTNVEELFERKLASQDPLAQEVLRALAVSGRPAAVRTLAAATRQPLKQMALSLNALRDARIIDRRIQNGELQFSFNRRRDLEVTERSMSDEDRARLHAGWASALAKEPDHGGPALLAYHQLRSDEPQRGVALAVQAAETHAVAGAINAAIEMLESARPHATRELSLSILSRLAELSPLTGSPRRALRYVDEWKAALPEEARGIAFQREADLYNAAGEYDLALVAVGEARRLTKEDSLVERARIEATASEAYYHLSNRVEAAAAAEHGLDMVSAIAGDATTRIRVELLNQLGKIALADDDHERAIALFTETREIAESSGLGSEQARALVNVGMVHLRRGETNKAEQILLAGIEKAREVNDLIRLAFGYMNLGVLMHQCGELGRALECYRECKSLFRRLDNRTQLARVLHNLGGLHLLCGDYARARAHNDEALRLVRQSGVERVVAIATVVDGIILGELGDREAGERRLREGLVLQRKIGTERPLEAMVELVEFHLRFDEIDRAAETLEEVQAQVAHVDSPVLRARAEHLAGLVGLELGHVDAAERLMAARGAFEALGRTMLVRDVEVALARAMIREGRREKARIHLAAAKEIQQSVAGELPLELQGSLACTRTAVQMLRIDEELEGRSGPSVVARAPERIAVPISEPAARSERVERTPEWKARYAATVGSSPKLLRVFHVLDRVAPSEATVLINGESGTGKELVAEAIHDNSPRAKGPFVKLNCAALVESLLLSELFGHERGSFTGAHQRKIGRFEMAAGGTLFLDEIGDISPKTQVALLRVLQEREFERVGGGRPIKVDARLVFATNRNLAQMVRDGTFREDLYYRLKGLTIDMPPLRERPEDVVELARHFLAQYASESGTAPKTLSPSGIALLTSYAWPGNIRELENIVRSVALFCESQVIHARDFDEYRELFQDGLGEAQPAARPISSPAPAAPIRRPIENLPAVSAESAPSRASPSEVSAQSNPDGDVDDALLTQIFEQGVALPDLKKRIQARAIAHALKMTDGNITRAAEVLGMRRPRLSQIINSDDELKALCQGVTR